MLPTIYDHQKKLKKMDRDQWNQHVQPYRKLIMAVSLYYRDQLVEPQINMYANQLGVVPFEYVKRAFGKLKEDPSFRRVPLPAVVRQIAWTLYESDRNKHNATNDSNQIEDKRSLSEKYMPEIWKQLGVEIKSMD